MPNKVAMRREREQELLFVEEVFNLVKRNRNRMDKASSEALNNFPSDDSCNVSKGGQKLQAMMDMMI